MSYTTSMWLTVFFSRIWPTAELYGKEDNTYNCIIVINSWFVSLALQVIH